MMKVLLCRFKQCLGPAPTLTVEVFSKIGPFRYLSQHVFRSQSFEKNLSSEAYLFVQNLRNLIEISEMQ